MKNIIEFLKKTKKINALLNFNFLALEDFFLKDQIIQIVDSKELICEYFSLNKINFISVENIYDYIFCIAYGLNAMKLIESLKQPDIEKLNVDLQPVFSYFIKGEIQRKLIEIYHNSVSDFIVFFSNSDNWNAFFKLKFSNSVCVMLCDEILKDKYSEIYSHFLKSDIPILGSENFEFICCVTNKIMASNKKNELKTLIFTDNYFEKWFNKNYLFKLNGPCLNRDFFNYIEKVIIEIKKSELINKKSIVDEIANSFIFIIKNLKNFDYYLFFDLKNTIISFNLKFNFISKTEISKFLNEANIEAAKRFNNDSHAVSLQTNFNIPLINQAFILNNEIFFVSLTHDFDTVTRKYFPFYFQQSQDKDISSIFSENILFESKIVNFDNLDVNNFYNEYLQFIIQNSKLFFSLFFIKENENYLYLYFKKSLQKINITFKNEDYNDVSYLLEKIFSEYINFAKNKNDDFFETHSILSETIMIFEFFLKKICTNFMPSMFGKNDFVKLQYLFNNCEKFIFLSKKEWLFLEFVLSTKKYDNDLKIEGLDLRNETIHYDYLNFSNKDLKIFLDIIIYLFFVTFNSIVGHFLITYSNL